MADPIPFKGTNIVMTAPPGRDDVQPVAAYRNKGCCVTCWQLTADELAEIAVTGRIYLSVLMGGHMAPVYVGGEANTRDLAADYGGTFPKQERPDNV